VRALQSDALPPFWQRVLYSDEAASNRIPVILKGTDPMFPAVDSYVRFMREFDEKLKKKKSEDPADEAKLQEELAEPEAKLKPLVKRKAELKLILERKLEPAFLKKKEAADTELNLAWTANSTVVHVAVDGRTFEITRNFKLADVNWSAREVQKFVQPAQYAKMVKQLRGDSTVSFALRDGVTGAPIPGAHRKPSKPKARAPATAAGATPAAGAGGPAGE
jgi:hypothetical protein